MQQSMQPVGENSAAWNEGTSNPTFVYDGNERYLNFGSGQKRFLFCRNDSYVENSRQDEDEAGGRCGSCGGIRRAHSVRTSEAEVTMASKHIPMSPKMSRMEGTKMTSRLTTMRRNNAMEMCLAQWKGLSGHKIWSTARRIYSGKEGKGAYSMSWFGLHTLQLEEWVTLHLSQQLPTTTVWSLIVNGCQAQWNTRSHKTKCREKC